MKINYFVFLNIIELNLLSNLVKTVNLLVNT